MNYFKPLIIFVMSVQSSLFAYEQAFPKTDSGTIELKTIPASRLIVSESDDFYFKKNNDLFRPLFRYIKRNDIAMTTPVEAEMMPGKMYFYIGGDARSRELESTANVRVVERPKQKVASIGVRGAYSEKNFKEALHKLETWVNKEPRYQAYGEARGIFWDGPWTLWFLKRFEVHLPVVEEESNAE